MLIPFPLISCNLLLSPFHSCSQHTTLPFRLARGETDPFEMAREAMESVQSCRKQNGGGGGGAASSPCAACKLLRRRCVNGCIFSPYFPADDPLKFAAVHKVFGASNVSKLLQEVSVGQRSDAVSSLVYEASARVRDPVYGCVAAISTLHRQVELLHAQLALAQAEIVHLHLQHAAYLAVEPLGSDAAGYAMETETRDSNNESFFELDHAGVDVPLPLRSCRRSNFPLFASAGLNNEFS
ncbi:hypothetical protein HPP92_017744 [Vanilla planifolia]|uniref:LOB domain-containing protein n=1 Tax=Vanilla planifolia TaxID=51239 RepID=A0A835UK62_VANPL|nr:hypothetical protein HPP92_017744 [Vanilla planifolia]